MDTGRGAERYRGSKRYPSNAEEQGKGQVAERHIEQNRRPEIQNHPPTLPYRPRRFRTGKEVRLNLSVCLRVGEDKARRRKRIIRDRNQTIISIILPRHQLVTRPEVQKIRVPGATSPGPKEVGSLGGLMV